MEQNNNDEIMDKLTKVCTCKGISRATIKEAIKKGAKTITDIQKTTGACGGSCSGRHCTEKIQELLES